MKKISDILDLVIGRQNIVNSNKNIYAMWSSIIEDSFLRNNSSISSDIIKNTAENSEVHNILNNKIIIEVKHGGWMQILSANKYEILNTIQKRYKELSINEISFKLSKQMR